MVSHNVRTSLHESDRSVGQRFDQTIENNRAIEASPDLSVKHLNVSEGKQVLHIATLAFVWAQTRIYRPARPAFVIRVRMLTFAAIAGGHRTLSMQ
jgi:hypothetical protein